MEMTLNDKNLVVNRTENTHKISEKAESIDESVVILENTEKEEKQR